MPEDQNYEVSMQKTPKWIYSASRKIRWLENGRSQNPWWGGWISEQSSTRCRATISGHSMDTILYVWNQNFTRDGEKSTKVSWTVTGQLIRIWQACEELSWNHRTSRPHRAETNGIAERAVRRVKEGTSAVLLQSGLHGKCDQILSNAIAICETSSTSWPTGKLHMKEALANHS